MALEARYVSVDMLIEPEVGIYLVGLDWGRVNAFTTYPSSPSSLQRKSLSSLQKKCSSLRTFPHKRILVNSSQEQP